MQHIEEFSLLHADIGNAKDVAAAEDRLVDGEIGLAQDVGFAAIGLVLIKHRVISRPRRELCADRARTVGLHHIRRDALVAEEDCGRAARDRLDPIHRAEIAVDQRRSEIELVAFAGRRAIVGEKGIKELDIDRQIDLRAPIHLALGDLNRSPDRDRNGGEDAKHADQRQTRHDAKSRREESAMRLGGWRRGVFARGVLGGGELNHGGIAAPLENSRRPNSGWPQNGIALFCRRRFDRETVRTSKYGIFRAGSRCPPGTVTSRVRYRGMTSASPSLVNGNRRAQDR